MGKKLKNIVPNVDNMKRLFAVLYLGLALVRIINYKIKYIMPFYTGKTADGSDMKEVEGFYINPDNDNEWSSKPYPKQQKAINTKNEVMDYMNGRYTLDDVYKQIQDKVCKLPYRLRQYVLSHYNDEGEFIAGD